MTNTTNTGDEEVDNVKNNEADITNNENIEENVGAVETENGENDKGAIASTTASASDNVSLPELSQLESDIIRQVEYYFGDENLCRDKFLLEQIAKDEQGWVPISVLVSFKRLAALSKDTTVIADALLKVDEGIVEVSEEKDKLRRNPELPIPEINDEHRKERSARTLYVNGFPLDSEIDTLINYFKSFKNVVHIYMRKYKCKASQSYKFKGSVFATFETKEQAEQFITNAKAKYNDKLLICKWQEDYWNEKRAEYMAKNKKKEKQKEENSKKINLPKGTILYFGCVSGMITREDIREAIENVNKTKKIAYIDFSKGEKSGYVRFSDDGDAKEFIKDLGEVKKLKIKDDEVDVRTLEDEEEKEYMDKATQAMQMRRQSKQKFRKRKGRNDNFESKKIKCGDD